MTHVYLFSTKMHRVLTWSLLYQKPNSLAFISSKINKTFFIKRDSILMLCKDICFRRDQILQQKEPATSGNGIRIFYTVNTGISGLNIFQWYTGIYSGLFFRDTGIPVCFNGKSGIHFNGIPVWTETKWKPYFNSFYF